MPIIVSRKTGEIISMPKYSQEQRNKAWEIIIREWAEKNPELLMQLTDTRKEDTQYVKEVGKE